jgi:acyl transferase domain-containing protein
MPATPDLVLAFSAQGGQWPGMGAVLYREDEVFRDAIDRCGDVIRERLGWSLPEEMARSKAAILCAIEDRMDAGLRPHDERVAIAGR